MVPEWTSAACTILAAMMRAHAIDGDEHYTPEWFGVSVGTIRKIG
jgi:hypothetical protein